MGVHRSSVYRWRKQKTNLEGDKNNGSKFYVNPKAHEAQNENNRKLCVTTAERRVMLSFLVVKASDMVKAKRHCPRDVSDDFATYLPALPEAAIVDDASDIEDESFDE
ncbi:hypothetical protein L915_20256 [Phytophthora nicotianae]|uniref:Uncharacterized protein n=1 Tax=Phytophthora nicotianae TaxID=4792 RepID=W2FRW9_PHYNI|nr:hypothetical protein L915_20256 [Phytophthora nicotianae]